MRDNDVDLLLHEIGHECSETSSSITIFKLDVLSVNVTKVTESLVKCIGSWIGSSGSWGFLCARYATRGTFGDCCASPTCGQGRNATISAMARLALAFGFRLGF